MAAPVFRNFKDKQNNDNRQRNQTHDHGIFGCHPQLFLYGLLIVAEREAGAENCALALAEGQINDVDLRKERNGTEEIAVEMHQEAAETFCRFFLNRMQRVNGKLSRR